MYLIIKYKFTSLHKLCMILHLKYSIENKQINMYLKVKFYFLFFFIQDIYFSFLTTAALFVSSTYEP